MLFRLHFTNCTFVLAAIIKGQATSLIAAVWNGTPMSEVCLYACGLSDGQIWPGVLYSYLPRLVSPPCAPPAGHLRIPPPAQWWLGSRMKRPLAAGPMLPSVSNKEAETLGSDYTEEGRGGEPRARSRRNRTISVPTRLPTPASRGEGSAGCWSHTLIHAVHGVAKSQTWLSDWNEQNWIETFSCSHVLATVAMNIGVNASFHIRAFIVSRYQSREEWSLIILQHLMEVFSPHFLKAEWVTPAVCSHSRITQLYCI